MNVLIACEESQEVCKAFRKLGHAAYSCDVLPCSGGHPEWHFQCDVFEVIDRLDWDLMIAHPPCTYLSHAGCRWLYPGGILNKERYIKGIHAKIFFKKLLNTNIEMIAIENPFPSPIYRLPKATQIIQPYQFGHKIQKKTLLWLKGLPELQQTNKVKCEWYYDRKGIRHTKLNNWGHKRSSKTFTGIAEAMAQQWGNIV